MFCVGSHHASKVRVSGVGALRNKRETRPMSHAVRPEDLHTIATPYGSTPFLLYVGSSGTARVNHVSVQLAEGSAHVHVTGFGRGIPSILSDDLVMSLLWPPHEDDGFSLIADGTGVLEPREPDATNSDARLILTITNAVLHRPAPTSGPATC